ncbi:SurA N-terminal domain-containing protein [Oceanospirillum beijerinckii]|uniref:SurA N-terminal domain-containing protein n=1 Tax=Oceanospirillum beijerinckii TaxID=64976 RepID=UPI0003F71A0F|nr:SurA N-terminal domain-containing protein [Oceanospirillum beijerinckii]
MLQNIRDNSSSWVVKVIVGFIIITFALFGAEAIVGAFTSGGDEVATVNDEKISRYELEVATQRQVRQILTQMGPDADPSSLNENMIRSSALQGLIEREAAVQAAQNAGLMVSDLQIDRLILNTPEFRGADGKFSVDQFNAMLRNVGLQPLQFRQELKKDVLINQLQSGIGLSGFTPDKYIERVLQLDSQTRTINYVQIKAADQAVTVTDDEIKQYYDANKAEFAVPEMVRLSYIQLSQDDLAANVDVTEEQLQGAYEAYRQKTLKQESYYASHILLETEDRTEAEAIEQLNQIKARIDAGESFADLAKEVSEDIGSSNLGGELGLVEAGAFDNDFESALFALEQGQVSEPVVTDFGVHLVRLDRKSQAEVASFELMRAELADELKDAEAAKAYLTLTEELANAAFASDDLSSVAEELKLKEAKTELFSAQGGQGIAADPKVIRAAFSQRLKLDGENSDLIELDDRTAVVVRVAEVKEATTETLVDVSGQIKAKLEQQKRIDQMTAQADQLLASVSADNTLEQVAKDNGLELAIINDVSRVDQVLPQAIVRTAFSIGLNGVGKAIQDGDVYLVSVSEVSQPEVKEEMVAFYKQAIELNQMRNDVQLFRTAISDEADVKRL